MTSTANKKLRDTQIEALEICQNAKIREYCLRIHLFRYDLSNPTQNGDCNNTASYILGDFVAFMIEAQDYFNGIPKMTPYFLQKMRMRKGAKFLISSKKTGERFKIELSVEHIDLSLWITAIEKLWQYEKFKI